MNPKNNGTLIFGIFLVAIITHFTGHQVFNIDSWGVNWKDAIVYFSCIALWVLVHHLLTKRNDDE